MGSEYCLGNHGDAETPQGPGVSLMGYEMSGLFDVYIDLPREFIDLDAWENAARVSIWKDLDPDELYRIGSNICRIAEYHGGNNHSA